MTRAIRTAVAVALVIGIALAIGVLGATRVMQRPAAPPVSYYLLESGRLARFAVTTDAQLHLSLRVPEGEASPPPLRYGLTVRLLARDEHVLATRALDFPARVSTNADAESSLSSAIDGVTVTPVPETAWLELEATSPQVAVQVTRPSARRRTLERRLPVAAAVDPRWLTSDELHALDTPRTEIVAAIGDVPVMSFARGTPRPRLDPPRPTVPVPHILVDSQRRAVFNLLGPGRAEVRVEGKGVFEAMLVGARIDPPRPFDPEAPLTVDLPVGLSSLVIAGRGPATGTPSIRLERATLVEGGPPLPASHRTPARWLAAGGVATVQVRGGLPLRVGVRGASEATGAVHVQLLDGAGAAIGDDHALVPSEVFDPFTAAEQVARRVPLRVETALFLVPPPAARAIRMSTTVDAIVAAEVLIEDASEISPAAPYDRPVPPGFRFVDVPGKAPQWFSLMPDGPRVPHGAAWTLVRSPRLEANPVPVPRPTLAILPQGGAPVDLREPAFDRTQADSVIVSTGTPARLIVADTGIHAHTLRLRCDARERLGEAMRVRIDGRDASSTPLLTDHVDVTVAAAPGPHLVELSGAPVTCLARARSGARNPIVVRQAVRIDPRGGVRLRIPRPTTPATVSCALYTTAATPTLGVDVMVDGGAPSRRTGEVHRITSGRRQTTVPVVDGVLLPGEHALRRGLVQVPLGDDLADGNHDISIRANDPGVRWARCWMPGERRRMEKVTTWFTTEE